MGKPRHATLTEPLVIEIKERLLAGEASRHIAPDYEVSAHCIQDIRNGKAWKGIGPSLEHLEPEIGHRWPTKLNRQLVNDIRHKRGQGASWGSLAREYGVSEGCIRGAVLGWSWTDEANLWQSE
jgi:hypothetical protein